MKGIIVLMFLVDVRCIFGIVCSNLVFMKIAFREKLLASSHMENEVKSVMECLENCRNDDHCKSVGIKVNSMTCVMYKQRAYAGQPVTGNADMVFYWQLEDECPTALGYEADPNSNICSKKSTKELSWSDAQTQCEKDGGHLFIADTQPKIDLLKSFNTDQVFLGATDLDEEGVWTWLNGVPVNRSQFNHNEPNNFLGNENCLVLRNTGYNDLNCGNIRAYICEVPTKQAYSPS